MAINPSAAYRIVLQIEVPHGAIGGLVDAIERQDGVVGEINLLESGKTSSVRSIAVDCRDERHAESVQQIVQQQPSTRLIACDDAVFALHRAGKITVENKAVLDSRDILSMAYTPGVARVCMAIANDLSKAFDYTIKNNMVAVVSDGTAVLGLGDIGPEGAMPVMEGKAMLFKEFGGVDAFPICLATKDPDEIVAIVKALAPTFGGINLEDISAPRCFEIEDRLKAELDIPVFHDDQHGTAVVALAALKNALKITGKRMEDLRVIVAGVGAAGVACSKIMMSAGVRQIIGVDRTGAIYKGRKEGMNSMKEWFADNTNPDGVQGGMAEACCGADLFLGVSGPGLLTVEHLKSMAKDPIVFAMANPVPEIMPEVAAPYVRIMATGRSDYPNQINNVLCFPGLFRGCMDVRARHINEAMKLAAADAIAASVTEEELAQGIIIPSVFDRSVGVNVAKAVARAAIETGEAEKH